MQPSEDRLVRLSQLGYRTEVTELADGQFYWHVWRHAIRVNGGLCLDLCRAELNANHAAERDSYNYRDPFFI